MANQHTPYEEAKKKARQLVRYPVYRRSDDKIIRAKFGTWGSEGVKLCQPEPPQVGGAAILRRMQDERTWLGPIIRICRQIKGDCYFFDNEDS